MFPILETQRLRLREIQHQDAGAIYNCFSNDDVTRYYGQDTLTTIEQALHSLSSSLTTTGETRDSMGHRKKRCPGSHRHDWV